MEFKRVIRIKTGGVSNITASSASASGIIQDVGENGIYQCGHVWSTARNPVIGQNERTALGAKNTSGYINSDFGGLNPGTTYYIRVYATDNLVTTYGNELSFETGNIISWERSFGGSLSDWPYFIRQTNDEGYIIAGNSYSDDGDASNNHGESDSWIVKLTSSGNIEWQKSYGGSSDESASEIQQTADGGYIVAANSGSNEGDFAGNHGDWDYWIIKLNSSGDIEWQKLLGGSGGDVAWSVKQTTDGGYIIAGESGSVDGDVTGNHGGLDYWIVKLTSTGEIEWQRSLGGSNDERCWSIQQTTDGGYITAGYSYSNDIDVTVNNGNNDYWIVKLNSSGEIEWQKSLGGSGNDWAWDIRQTTDEGYIIAGLSRSNDFNVSENHGEADSWIVKLNSSGDLEWEKSLGGSAYDRACSIQQTTDGNYIIAGDTYSDDGDVSGNHGDRDYWIVKLSSSGEIIWQMTFGGSGADHAYSIQQTTDGGYIIAGNSYSNDGDVSQNHGENDMWIIKMNQY